MIHLPDVAQGLQWLSRGLSLDRSVLDVGTAASSHGSPRVTENNIDEAYVEFIVLLQSISFWNSQHCGLPKGVQGTSKERGQELQDLHIVEMHM